MGTTFEWVDFALQPPGVVIECLDAAGIDGSVPGHAADEAGRAGGLPEGDADTA